jgi:hypothetical protein
MHAVLWVLVVLMLELVMGHVIFGHAEEEMTDGACS